MRERPTHTQSGFTLIEVMTAAMVLSIFVIGIGAFWTTMDRQANDLVLREKALLVANGELERLSALYNFTSFGSGGAAATAAYEATSSYPTSRLTYPTALSPTYTGPGDNYITTSSTTFSGNAEAYVWVNVQGLASMNRSYVWLDASQNAMGRLSWIVTSITPAQCVVGTSCVCRSFDGASTGNCQKLTLFFEYPYRIISGLVTPGQGFDSISLSTIVGRRL